MRSRTLVVAALAAVSIAAAAYAQHQHGEHQHGASSSSPTPTPAPAGKKPPMRVTMEEMHHGDGVPKGWRFSWPDGDAAKGREVFAKLECYQCHAVPGAGFPEVKQDPTRQGPPLGGMGDMHPAEYFAESILNPNAVIVAGPGFTGPDGLSIMPDFRDSLTLAETIDLVAYIRSLTGGGHHAHGGASAPREQVTADYRVRVVYAVPGASDHDHHHGASSSPPAPQQAEPPAAQPQQGGQPAAPHQHGGAATRATAHLMVFVTDVVTGEPVPYLPMLATVHDDKATPRVVRLLPMLGDRGFHYGANVTLPPSTTRLTVAIGRPTVIVMPSRSGRPARTATTVTFEWSH